MNIDVTSYTRCIKNTTKEILIMFPHSYSDDPPKEWRLEVCRRWEFPWVPWVPWESHGNGNKGAMGMGMGMGMGIS